mmetsp:Transcript_18666/g.44218  ORF Transcript_18666/g.44218 Transcript_18666/m.44218 type:complete len:430 (+) Transcript_18666:245-1534(+)
MPGNFTPIVFVNETEYGPRWSKVAHPIQHGLPFISLDCAAAVLIQGPPEPLQVSAKLPICPVHELADGELHLGPKVVQSQKLLLGDLALTAGIQEAEDGRPALLLVLPPELLTLQQPHALLELPQADDSVPIRAVEGFEGLVGVPELRPHPEEELQDVLRRLRRSRPPHDLLLGHVHLPLAVLLEQALPQGELAVLRRALVGEVEAALLRHPAELIPTPWNALLQLVDGAIRKGVAKVGDVIPLLRIGQVEKDVGGEALVVFGEVKVISYLLGLNIREESTVAQSTPKLVQLSLFFIADPKDLLIVNIHDAEEGGDQGFLAKLRGAVDPQDLPHLHARQIDVVRDIPGDLDLGWAVTFRLLQDDQELLEGAVIHQRSVAIWTVVRHVVQLQDLLFRNHPLVKALKCVGSTQQRLVRVQAVADTGVVPVL